MPQSLKLAVAIVKDVFAHPKKPAHIEVEKDGTVKIERTTTPAPTATTTPV